MRVLTVRQPWAWAIIHGGKDVENRTRNIAGDYRGPVAIQAGLGWSVEACDDWSLRRAICSDDIGREADDSQTWSADSIERMDDRFEFGAVIGVVDLVDVKTHIRGNWVIPGHHHLMLTNPRPIDPIPAKGRLGLWRPDPELQAQIEEALT